VASAWADLLINIFAPRNPGEFRRVVRPLGHLLVVIPAMDHLRELGTIVPLLPVAPNKEDTLRATLPDFGLLARREVAFEVKLPGPVADGLLAMTPNAWAVPLHARQKLRERSFIAARASFIGLLFRRTENP
jgi:23S rRNA (guanine745-N1)-methyltransferase